MSLATAIKIAATVHENQRDKGGKAYILHPLRIMMRLRTDDEELMSIAVLHDVVEDGKNITWSYLESIFSKRVITALRLLTHNPGDDYLKVYIPAIASNYDSCRIKVQDLKDNGDFMRLKGVTEKDLERLNKYALASDYLKKAILAFETPKE